MDRGWKMFFYFFIIGIELCICLVVIQFLEKGHIHLNKRQIGSSDFSEKFSKQHQSRHRSHRYQQR